MSRPRRSHAFVALLLVSAVPAAAASAECSRATAERATVPEIAQHPERFEGSCVVVDGVMQGQFLYESVDGVYLRSKEYFDPTAAGFRLGLDLAKPLRRATGGYQHASIVGRVQDCETLRDEANASAGPDEFVWVSGYCHYYNGTYLWIKDVRFRSGPPFLRQMGSYERKDYGNIEPAPPGWPYRAKIEALAATFLAALRAGDRKTLADIHFGNVGLDWKEEQAELLHFLLADRKSPFASLLLGTGTPQQLILLDRPPLDDEPTGDASTDGDGDDYAATICFCREQDCSELWPIAHVDADNLPTRPYACTRIDPYLDGGRTLPNFSTPIEKHGLTEPRHDRR
jgi:hypothetical protein